HRPRIDLDRLQGAAQLSEGEGQGPVAGTPFDDVPAGRGDDRDEAGDGAAVTQEVLAQFMGSGMVAIHAGSSWDGGSRAAGRTARRWTVSGANASGSRDADPRRQRRRIRMTIDAFIMPGTVRPAPGAGKAFSADRSQPSARAPAGSPRRMRRAGIITEGPATATTIATISGITHSGPCGRT